MVKSFTKIIATIGPSSKQESTIREMILSGMAAARLNFSYGAQSDHRNHYEIIRRVSKELDQPIAIIQDLQGPKIRVGKLPGGAIHLQAGKQYTMTSLNTGPPGELLPVDVSIFARELRPGQQVLFADGLMEGRVVSLEEDAVVVEVTLGGDLKENQGINLPGVYLNIPALTAKDKSDLKFGLALGVDAIAISFVRSVTDLQQARLLVEELQIERSAIPLIAKLERPEALVNLEDILDAADGVMVARGDLGVEMPPEDVPVAQKRIIEAANSKEKIVITATQMLESMIQNPRPTRAEASDVANAIFDGTDGVMLSGETAVGAYPVESVRMMHEIAVETERHLDKWGRGRGVSPVDDEDSTYFATRAAFELASDPRVRAIALFSQSGRTARLMSKARPKVPILGFTTVRPVFHRMQLEWGVSPYWIDEVTDFESMISCLEDTILGKQMLSPGDHVVVVCGFPVGENRPPNLALLYPLGQGLSDQKIRSE